MADHILTAWVNADRRSGHHHRWPKNYKHTPKASSQRPKPKIEAQTPKKYPHWRRSSIESLRFNSTNTPKPLVIVTPTQISHIQAAIHCSRKHGLQTRTRSGGHDYEGLSSIAKVPFVIIDLVRFRSVDVDVDNRVAWVQSGSLIEKSMGEDLFWAIRGGCGGSLGIVLAWKLSLVSVPANVTVFSVTRILEQNATELVHRWKYIARDLPDEVYSTVILRGINSTQDGRKTVLAMFSSLFFGTIDELLPLMEQRFPELGLTRQNCTEMSYVQSLMVNNGLPNQPSEIFLSRVPIVSPSYKAKSDYVKEPISVAGLNGLFSRLTDETVALTTIVFVAFGGIMDRIPENAMPFPHRAGILYKIFYDVGWQEEDNIPRLGSKYLYDSFRLEISTRGLYQLSRSRRWLQQYRLYELCTGKHLGSQIFQGQL
ncbi:FAD-binding Berberine family protein [Hibiscus syriacus]|uniref:FAD-binding Berberine family protein n=1 Tax=Hibiscus syriacus TaxID=106335 RepID=A0A6A2Y369_HIBSY|nr:FAD-binding Berberine family protein [Hibiscus syriacus]